MKTLKYIVEEIVPLSRKQNIVLFVIITCVFQFVLFYAPALADQAVREAKAQENSLNTYNIDDIISNSATIIAHDTNAELTKENLASSSTIIKYDDISLIASSSTPTKITIATSTAPKVKSASRHVITAYNSEVGQTDDDPCTTANGFNLCKNNKEDSIAANFLKFGTKVRIPELFGDHIFVVRDRMNSRHATRVDVWMKNHSDAMKFGVKNATIEVLE